MLLVAKKRKREKLILKVSNFHEHIVNSIPTIILRLDICWTPPPPAHTASAAIYGPYPQPFWVAREPTHVHPLTCSKNRIPLNSFPIDIFPFLASCSFSPCSSFPIRTYIPCHPCFVVQTRGWRFVSSSFPLFFASIHLDIAMEMDHYYYSLLSAVVKPLGFIHKI